MRRDRQAFESQTPTEGAPGHIEAAGHRGDRAQLSGQIEDPAYKVGSVSIEAQAAPAQVVDDVGCQVQRRTPKHLSAVTRLGLCVEWENALRPQIPEIRDGPSIAVDVGGGREDHHEGQASGPTPNEERMTWIRA
jgi:hypothetical protein